MSFHWNLSSDEEDETEEWKSKLSEAEKSAAARAPQNLMPTTHVTPTLRQEATKNDSSVAKMPVNNQGVQGFDFSEDDDDEESVDWEDVDDDGGGGGGDAQVEEDSKMPAKETPTPRPVTIDMNPKTTKSSSKTKKKKRGRRSYRFHSLPPHLQSQLIHIQQSHLLALASRAMQISRCSSDLELLHVVHSLVPVVETNNNNVPTEAEVRAFVSWYTDFVNHVAQRRRNIRAANEAAGAPAVRRSKKRKAPPLDVDRLGSVQPDRLLEIASYLSPANDDHPPLNGDDFMELSNQDKVQLLVAMVRSKGWRARYVTALEPIPCDLSVDHPLFLMNNVGNVFRELAKRKVSKTSLDCKPSATRKEEEISGEEREVGWLEILCKPSSKSRRSESKSEQYRWMHVDPSRSLIDQPNAVETVLKNVLHNGKGARKATIAYALAVEHIARNPNNAHEGAEEEDLYQLRLTDVTPRYANSWSQSLRLRSAKTSRTDAASDNAWWTETLKTINNRSKDGKSTAKLSTNGTSKMEAIEIDDSSDENGDEDSLDPDEAIERAEHAELSAANEAIPTSKAAFNNHPVYAIPSVLKANEVFAPDAKTRICGIFKGVPVYRRSDVHTALAAKKWLYQGRKVKDEEMKKPAKRVKARKKPTPKGFKPLQSYGVGAGNDGSEEAQQRDIAKASLEENDGMVNLYGFWQTLPWSPIPVGPNDPIPVNEYNNVELDLLNPGLVHLAEHGVSRVAKKLGIPYAPCLLGFEGHGGNRTPTIRGVVVHEHNVDILNCARSEFMSGQLEKEHEKRAERIRKRWKTLIAGLLTRERIEREYG